MSRNSSQVVLIPIALYRLRIIAMVFFQYAVVAYLGFYILDQLSPGFVSHYFDLDSIVYAAIIGGVLLLPTLGRQPEPSSQPQTIWMVLIPSLAAGLYIWLQTSQVTSPLPLLFGCFGALFLGIIAWLEHQEESTTE